jgi:hypothetical protein
METDDSLRMIDAVHDMRASVSSACNRIEDVAAVLEEVGMSKLSGRLMFAINGLSECSRRLSEAYGEQLNDDLRHNETMTANLFLLALKAVGEKPA